MTDDEVREAFHGHLDEGLLALQPPPGVLADLRRRQVRRSRATVGAATLAAVGAMVGVPVAVRAGLGGSGDAAQPGQMTASPTVAQSATAGRGPRVKMAGYVFQVPPGLKVTDGPRSYNLTTARPPQPVPGVNHLFSASNLPAPSAASSKPLPSREARLRRFSEIKTAMDDGGYLGAPGQVGVDVIVSEGAIGRVAYQVIPPNYANRHVLTFGSSPGWAVTFANGHLVQVRVQVTPERAIDVLAENLSEAQVTAMVRIALAGS